jgi:hypothetical protein
MGTSAWAVVDDNGISVRSVSTTPGGAMRNWLLKERGCFWALEGRTTDARIIERWNRVSKGATVETIIITLRRQKRGPAAEDRKSPAVRRRATDEKSPEARKRTGRHKSPVEGKRTAGPRS